jgi:hypothetical protein
MGKGLEDHYEEMVDNLIVECIESGLTGFSQLLTSLPGVYPSILLKSLQRLSITSRIDERIYKAALAHSQDDLALRYPIHFHNQHQIKLPIQHPLDYEWRFNEVASKKLLDDAVSLAGPEGQIVLIGTPSVLRTAIEHQDYNRIALLDANPLLVHRFASVAPRAKVIQCDLSIDPLPTLAATAVILDPPWYKEYIQLFIWAASELLISNGHLLISLPPIGTRPGVKSELESLLEWSRKELGLSLVRIERGTLPYLTPLFERNALRAENILNFPRDWRRGDLWVLKASESTPHRQVRADSPAVNTHVTGSWDEVVLWGMRVRFRKKENTPSVFIDPSLNSIVNGDVLPSVSRRDPRRSLIDVWTSGNRVFSSQGTHILDVVMRAISANRSPHEQVAIQIGRKLNGSESVTISDTIRQLTEIARIERCESLHYCED